jgi:hypothetical protein
MTEREWLTGTDPAPMMELLGQNARTLSRRKLRLFACDCCRRLERLLTARDRAVVDALEQCAEGAITHDQIYAAADLPPGMGTYASGPGGRPAVQRVVAESLSGSAWNAAVGARAYTIDAVRAEEGVVARADEWVRQSAVLRCLFGNPFRRVWFSTDWLTDTVLALAQAMYESRDFEAMPILADALQDAGCENAGILNHCRAHAPADGAQAHTHGCWVLELILTNSGWFDRLEHAAVTV